MADYLIADTETTGVNVYDKVVEIAWVVINDDFMTLDSGYSLINPHRPIPEAASEVHGITAMDVVTAPSIEEYFRDCLDGEMARKDVIFTAFNSRFDYRFLRPYLYEGTPQMCAYKLARKIYPNLSRHNLQTVITELGIDLGTDRFHSAEVDVKAVKLLLSRMAEDTGRSLLELFEYSNEPVEYTTMPFGKHKGTPLDKLPRDYVYWYLNKATDIDPDLVQSLKNHGH